jgi:hypothetical protein
MLLPVPPRVIGLARQLIVGEEVAAVFERLVFGPFQALL